MTRSLRPLIVAAIALAVLGVAAILATAAVKHDRHESPSRSAAKSCWKRPLSPRQILLLRRGPLNEAAARRVACGGDLLPSRGG